MNSLVLNLTSKCSFYCKHCFYGCKETGKDINYENAIRLLNEEKGFFDEVWLTGGEPLEYTRFDSIFKEIREAGPRTGICTNGWHFQDKRKLFEDHGLSRAVFSLDGAKRSTNDSIRREGSYDRVISSVKLAKEMGIHVDLRFIITRLNIPEFEDYVELALNKLGVNQVIVGQALPFGRALLNEVLADGREVGRVIDIAKNHSQRSRIFLEAEADLEGNCPYVTDDLKINVFWDDNCCLCCVPFVRGGVICDSRLPIRKIIEKYGEYTGRYAADILGKGRFGVCSGCVKSRKVF